jgi:hypothetical protein
MAKVTVITNREGRVLGSIRTDPVKTDRGIMQFKARTSSEQKSHDLDIPDELLNQDVENLHRELERRLK